MGAQQFQAVIAGESFAVLCESHKPVRWLFQSYQDESQTFQLVSHNHRFVFKNLEFGFSGLYYCHGDLSGGEKFLSHFILYVYGKKITKMIEILLCFDYKASKEAEQKQ